MAESLTGWGLVFYLVKQSAGLPLANTCLIGRTPVRLIFAGFSIGLGLGLTALSLIPWILFSPPESGVQLSEQVRATAQFHSALAMLVVGLRAEELFFCGWVPQGWRERCGTTRALG